MKLGIELTENQRVHCVNAFVHRFTGDNKPQWAQGKMKGGKPYPLQFSGDMDWLAHTKFFVTKRGQLDKRFNHCESRPTWPNNPELRQEVSK